MIRELQYQTETRALIVRKDLRIKRINTNDYLQSRKHGFALNFLEQGFVVIKRVYLYVSAATVAFGIIWFSITNLVTHPVVASELNVALQRDLNYRRIRSSFPEWYALHLKRLVSMINRGANDDEVSSFVDKEFYRLRSSRIHFVREASSHALRRLVRSRQALIKEIEIARPEMCSIDMLHGKFDERAGRHKATLDAVVNHGTATLEAILDGRTTRAQRDKISKAGLSTVMNYLLKLDWSDEELARLRNGAITERSGAPTCLLAERFLGDLLKWENTELADRILLEFLAPRGRWMIDA